MGIVKVDMSSAKHLLLTAFELMLKGLGPQHWWPGESPFEVMVGAVLTQNTSWSNVERAIANLKGAGVLSPVEMSSLPPEKLAKLIRPSGFYNLKEKRLRALLSLLVGEFCGNIETMRAIPGHRLRPLLLGIPGIGPETADSILLYALEKPFFVVDAYTKRILERMGIMEEDAPYSHVQRLFMENLPASTELYNEFHALLVVLGKELCKKNRPTCHNCPLSPLCSKGVERYPPLGYPDSHVTGEECET